MTQLTDTRPAIGAGPALSSPAPLRPAPDFGPTDRARGWLVTIFLTAVAAVTRFTMLNYPTDAGTPVFDEKHYAPQAWQMLTGGGVEDNPAYGLVVHPPVGKQMIALGEAIFGYTSWGWRFTAAVFGSLLVLLVIRITRRMARSTLIGAIAGVLLIADGVTFVSSRIGMLDIFQAVFVVGAFGCLIVDRDEMRARLARADAEGRIAPAARATGLEAAARVTTAGTGSAAIAFSAFGPRLGVRWWRFGAGLLLGLSCGTKWSGLYFILFFGLMTVCFDVAARKAYGVPRPWVGTAVRDIGPALYALVLIPLLVYLTSYWGWFASEDGYDRYSVGNAVGAGGTWSWVPDALRSLWHNQAESLKFHESLTNSAGNHHPWESKPWSWPMGLRPMLYYYADNGVTGCGQSVCVKAVMLIGTPAMWWLSLPMLAWALWRTATRRDWRYAAMLVGYGAGLLPWFADLDRQMYYFYAVPMAPFLVMGLALTLGDILGPAPLVRARSGRWFALAGERRSLGLLLVCLYLGLVIANFIWLWPILTALPITPSNWHDHLWLPSWR
ncbi:dolichyl-phosphate-mannose--protein mannosyltransferase [Nocardia sp. 852002-20019_SCH5090214]|uniref:Polyprenol-phosphate-mannose--protein mannosyltransferase n=1 Tax=Nocardia nova TaxID=37330 RepID=A0A2S5ZVP2_9NOCA|nr:MULTISPECIES: phospholipid carrier-dependent glycosyltransferase [Nocardia]OBA65514.1 dolichyl-phosphate-mannose--protein mannosyltransferase [Nocardia sp. 852002-20019_SCH5090214]PPJ20085.1 phospholipid carrier-dependent glycosyltransferase [Nocardia nova]